MKTDAPPPTDAVIEIKSLSRRFGSELVLDKVSLDIPRGVVFGLVGENGAGKTTLIKHILGLLKAQSGSIRVFGLDPVADPVGVLGRVGYLSEQRDLPLWMRVDELLRYTQAFYPKWDAAYAGQLRGQFGLHPASRIKSLSRGECAKAGLLLALAHRPELLLLDEPSSGLDPVVRRDILEAIIRTVVDEGRTVFFLKQFNTSVIEVEDFTRNYREFTAVRDLSFAVHPGEIVGLVGANRAGKTTTLRAITGILRPSAGTVRIVAFDIEREPVAAKQQFAYVPDTIHPCDLLCCFSWVDQTRASNCTPASRRQISYTSGRRWRWELASRSLRGIHSTKRHSG